jgi:prepilin-type N-terminal cleavage/methylation domain-containing protein/prepilin-type processing-associated H-X9-DG protein
VERIMERIAMQDRRAFSLIELLVVIAVIGVLIALLLPAVQAARETARRMHCANNLKQIGLALHGHHEANGALPAGNFAQTAGVCPGGGKPGVDYPSEDRANWAILILPYLEHEQLFEQYDFHTYNEAPENAAVREARVAAYLCPSDSVSDEPTIPGMGPASEWGLGVAYQPGSYAGVSGRSDGLKFLDNPEDTTYERDWRGPLHIVGVLNCRAERFRNITDGLAHTLMVGESVTQAGPRWRKYWAYSYAFYSLSSTVPQPRTLSGDWDQCNATSGRGHIAPCWRGWGGPHAAGANFLRCDGSVDFIDDQIDPELFAALGSIAGEEPEHAGRR